MSNKIKGKNKLFYSLVFLVTILFFTIIYKSIGIYYAINDDTSMRKITAGSFDGNPDAHMVYIRYVLGVILSFVFKKVGGIDWYGLFMLGTMALSISSIVYKLVLCSKNNKSKYTVVSGLLLIFVLFFRHIAAFQWTVVAGIAVTAVIVLLILKEEKYKTDFESVMIILLSVIAFTIRKKVFFMTAPLIFFVLFGLYFLPIAKKGIDLIGLKKLARPIIWFLVIGLFFGMIEVVDKKAYSDGEWKMYRAFNSARSRVMDYGGFPLYEGNEEFYDGLGISKEEAACLEMFDILENIDVEKMNAIADYCASQKKDKTIEERLYKMGGVAKTAITSEKCFAANVIAAIGVLYLLIDMLRNRKNILTKLLGLMTQFGVLLYLIYMGRFPTRIIWIFDFYTIFFCFAMILSETERVSDRKKIGVVLRMIFLVLLCRLSLLEIKNTVEAAIDYETGVMQLSEIDEYVRAQDGANIFIRTGMRMTRTREQFTVHKELESVNKFGTAGWSSHAPYMNRKKEMAGIDLNDKTVLLNDNVKFLTDKLEDADRICEYYSTIKEGVWYEIEECREFSGGLEVYVCLFHEK